MKKPTAKTQREKPEIEQLSQAELVELVLGLQKIIEELQEKLAIANGNGCGQPVEKDSAYSMLRTLVEESNWKPCSVQNLLEY